MAFSQLPNEIVAKIISHLSILHNPEDADLCFRALHSLSLSSPRLRHITEPVLYQVFRETNEYSLLLFLRSISTVPRLTQYVRRYEGMDTRTAFGACTLFFPVTKNQHKNRKDTLSALLAMMERIDLSSHANNLWFEDLRVGNWDAATALAIVGLPNLETLKLVNMCPRRSEIDTGVWFDRYDDPYDPVSYRWINRALRDAQQAQLNDRSTLFSCNQLANIELGMLDPSAKNGRTDGSVSQLVPFLGLPSVTKFKAEGLWFYKFELESLLAQQETPGIFATRCIELRNCAFEVDVLGPFFSLFSQLESLYLSMPEDEILQVTVLLASLVNLRCSLCHLVIRGYDGGTHGEMQVSLLGFDLLETLDITGPFSIRWQPVRTGPNAGEPTLEEVLPPGIKHLTLRMCLKSIFEQVVRLVELKKAGERAIESLHLDFLWDFPVTFLKEMERFRLDCVDAGVVFTAALHGKLISSFDWEPPVIEQIPLVRREVQPTEFVFRA